jgi:hypothetical protein
VISSTKVQEVRVGYNNFFQWANQGLPQVGDRSSTASRA